MSNRSARVCGRCGSFLEIVMLGGGNKSTQPADIAKAIEMAKELKI